MKRFLLTIAFTSTILLLTIIISDTTSAHERSYNTEHNNSINPHQRHRRINYSTPEPILVDTVTEEPESDSDTFGDKVTSEESYLITLGSEIHRLTNLERSKANLPTLAYDNSLAQVATGHSQDMLKRSYFAHTSPDGCNMACRLAEADYPYWFWGENIAWRKSIGTPSAEVLAKHFVDAWMNSPGHKANLLSKNFTHEGIGLSAEGNLVYVTASFADPR